MTIVYNDITKTTLNIKNGCLVLENAFTKGGVFQDIVFSDGDRQFQLGESLDPSLKEKIQTIFAACIEANATVPNSNPPENAYFVYTKTPPALNTDGRTQTQAITDQGGAGLNIGHKIYSHGTRSIDEMMAELAACTGITWYKNMSLNLPPAQVTKTDSAPAQPGVAPSGTASLSTDKPLSHKPAPKRKKVTWDPKVREPAVKLTPEKRRKPQPLLARLGGAVRRVVGANGEQLVRAVDDSYGSTDGIPQDVIL